MPILEIPLEPVNFSRMKKNYLILNFTDGAQTIIKKLFYDVVNFLYFTFEEIWVVGGVSKKFTTKSL